jgi:4-hydroxy-3-methylbut-2-enyl diphosphate reductase IspH
VNDLKSIDFSNVNTVALTSGASTPKTIVDAIINELEKYK